jgi:hypothetical protein
VVLLHRKNSVSLHAAACSLRQGRMRMRCVLLVPALAAAGTHACMVMVHPMPALNM